MLHRNDKRHVHERNDRPCGKVETLENDDKALAHGSERDGRAAS